MSSSPASTPPAASPPDPGAAHKPRCIFHARGYCRNGPACAYSHAPSLDGAAVRVRRPRKAAQKEECGICFESPAKARDRYGLLIGCDHAFCMPCIAKWRRGSGGGRNEMRRTCPVCRCRSDYVVASFEFVTGEEKKAVVDQFRRNCARIRCKYYGGRGGCPFELGCFYMHVNADGTVVDKEAAVAAGGGPSVVNRMRRAERDARMVATGQREVAFRIIEDVLGTLEGRGGRMSDVVVEQLRRSVARAVSEGVERGGGAEIDRVVDVFLTGFESAVNSSRQDAE